MNQVELFFSVVCKDEDVVRITAGPFLNEEEALANRTTGTSTRCYAAVYKAVLPLKEVHDDE